MANKYRSALRRSLDEKLPMYPFVRTLRGLIQSSPCRTGHERLTINRQNIIEQAADESFKGACQVANWTRGRGRRIMSPFSPAVAESIGLKLLHLLLGKTRPTRTLITASGLLEILVFSLTHRCCRDDDLAGPLKPWRRPRKEYQVVVIICTSREMG